MHWRNVNGKSIGNANLNSTISVIPFGKDYEHHHIIISIKRKRKRKRKRNNLHFLFRSMNTSHKTCANMVIFSVASIIYNILYGQIIEWRTAFLSVIGYAVFVQSIKSTHGCCRRAMEIVETVLYIFFLCVIAIFMIMVAYFSITIHGEKGANNITKWKYNVANAIDSPKQRRFPDRKIIYFVHASKSGGSSIYDAAIRSGLSVPINNGIVQENWRCCGNEDTVDAQVNFAKTSKFDLVACENEMYDAMDTDQYSYVVVLRDSRIRYRSLWRQWQMDPIMFFFQRKVSQHFITWLDWFPQDNWAVRQICGSKCMASPKFQLTVEDFEYTLRRLEKFDSILFLEDFTSSYDKFANKHQWGMKQLPSTRVRITKTTISEQELSYTDKMFALDDALYEYAKKLEKARSSNSSTDNNKNLIHDNMENNINPPPLVLAAAFNHNLEIYFGASTADKGKENRHYAQSTI